MSVLVNHVSPTSHHGKLRVIVTVTAALCWVPTTRSWAHFTSNTSLGREDHPPFHRAETEARGGLDSNPVCLQSLDVPCLRLGLQLGWSNQGTPES